MTGGGGSTKGERRDKSDQKKAKEEEEEEEEMMEEIGTVLSITSWQGQGEGSGRLVQWGDGSEVSEIQWGGQEGIYGAVQVEVTEDTGVVTRRYPHPCSACSYACAEGKL